jgi:hypothetical protein
MALVAESSQGYLAGGHLNTPMGVMDSMEVIKCGLRMCKVADAGVSVANGNLVPRMQQAIYSSHIFDLFHPTLSKD